MKKFIVTPSFLLFFIITMFLSIPFLLFFELAKLIFGKKKARFMVWRFLSLWAKMCLFCAGVKVEKYGDLSLKEGFVIYPNHQSYFDILVLLSALDEPIAFVAKDSLRWLFPLGCWISKSGGIFISRKSTKREFEKIRNICDRLKEGMNFVIFPEGTRSKNGKLGKFRSGAFRIPLLTGVFSVAICIVGTYIINCRGNIWINPSKVKIYISEPIPATKDIENEVRGFIEEKLQRAYGISSARGIEYATKR